MLLAGRLHRLLPQMTPMPRIARGDWRIERILVTTQPATISHHSAARARLSSFLWVFALLLAVGCRAPGPDPIAEGKRLQAEIRRGIIETKSLGRFGLFALFQEAMEAIPCEVPLSESNNQCDVQVVGRGHVRLTVADSALAASAAIRKDALISVEYRADCENQGFDFKSIDNALPRASASQDTTVWQSKRVRVTHRRLHSLSGDECRVLVEAHPALLEQVASAPSLL